jgi:hypothetical protein
LFMNFTLGISFTTLHFIHNLLNINGPNKQMIYYTRPERLAGDKPSSLLGLFVIYVVL